MNNGHTYSGPLYNGHLGAEKGVVIQRFTLFRGCFVHMAMYLDPHEQSVIERFSLSGKLVRGSTAFTDDRIGWNFTK